MDHESGNEVEPDPRKKPAKKKEGGATSRLLNPGRWEILWITSNPQKWNNPGEQAADVRIAALRGGIAGASPSKENQGSSQPGTKFPDRAMGQ
jgi:hypothetical protein